jgi:hypothetical protein
MCDGMRIDRRLVLIGVMVIVLSMTMATQYATTKIGYEFAIVNPSDADIRFVGSDTSSDGIYVLRVENNDTAPVLKIVLGNISLNVNKSYTAAFAIANEERYNVTITHINLSNTDGADYMQIWLHENRSALATASGEHSVLVWNKADVGYTAASSIWGLRAGDQDPSNMGVGGTVLTPWDADADVRINTTSAVSATNNTQDHVWVQISIDVPDGADIVDSYSGTIYVHTRATTHDE